jgi:hypothetical protein
MALLGFAVGEIMSDDPLWIQERLLGEAETDAMLSLVLRVLFGIPFKAGHRCRRLALIWVDSNIVVWVIQWMNGSRLGYGVMPEIGKGD